MTRRWYLIREGFSRLFVALSLMAGELWLSPLPTPAQAAPAPAAAGAPAAVAAAAAAAKPVQDPPPPLPDPFPTILVTTGTIADDPNDHQCDLWEAM